MRTTQLLFVLTIVLAGCGTPGDLYLPSGEKSEVGPTSIEGDDFQPKSEEEEEQNK